MIIISYIRKLSIAALLLATSSIALATADAETPEQELEILRLVLLESEIHTVFAKMKEAGCIWHSEFIWFYAPEKITEDIYKWGGELVIQFEPKYIPEKSVRFSFTGKHTKAGKSIDSVKLISDERNIENCAF